ncbi:DNA repair protein rad2 [Pichia californica]|nr:DNA repair protein rad2 [[Candida] californica]
MGVHGLWDLVGPSARPVRLEALRNKRLAVDASIWIYQFLKAVRDKEGNQLKNSHIVGFLRRICKLLYFGIKPVFVFDGGVPALKKDTIRKRKEKREGNKESIEQTAQKILAKQLQLFADGKLETPKLSNTKISNTKAKRREIPTEGLYFDTYYDDQVEDTNSNSHQDEPLKNLSPKKKDKESKMFKSQDDYDLPINGPIEVKETDNRVMASYEYDRLTKDINDDLDGLDLNNIDPQSPEFERLPLSTQYIALSHLRLRSRLRMGYTKEQLQTLFSDPMEFSKFQIKMVQKRNFYTQKVMTVTGMDGDDNDEVVSRRIASDKNRAYDLKRTGDGYALTISKQEADGDTSQNPIFLGDVNEYATTEGKSSIEFYDSGSDENIDWDDVEVIDEKPIEKKEYQSEKKENVVVTNPLFVQDSDNEQVDESSDEESIEMEDVPLETGDNNLVEGKEQEDDEIMKKIKYLYEYSAKNNRKKSSNSEIIELPSDNDSDDVDIDEYQEIQLKQVEDDDLRKALEKSKKEYLNILEEEKTGNIEQQSLKDEAPIILSLSSLSKTLGIPNFSMKNSLLSGNNVAKFIKEKKDDKKTTEENEKNIKKLLPLPDWFSSETNFKSNSFSKESTKKEPLIKLTEDEKAGLVSYGEIENYLSSDEDNDIEFIDVKTKTPITEISNSERENHSIEINDVDLDVDDKVNNENLIVDDSTKKSRSPEPQAETVSTKKITKISAEPHIHHLKEDVDNAIHRNDDESSLYLGLGAKNKLQAINDELTENSAPKSEKKVKLNFKSKQTPHLILGTDRAQTNDNNNNNNNNLEEDGDDVFSDEDDDDVNLILDMEEENIATDKFYNELSGVQKTSNSGELWTFTDENALQERLRKQKRDSDEVSTNMITDVQDLLSRFGIPFITAPMEAEAQCAELELIGLVDGIITDDSDCFLFGGDKIYKNLFNEKNFVECYQDNDILEELGLDRSNMIELAILLGSDYTDGIKGIGKVMAIEILAEFKNLKNFKDWWVDYQNGKIEATTDTPLRKKIRRSLGKSLYLDNSFPNKLIYHAYLHPEVDHDKTDFKWGYPDLERLNTFLMYYVGWSKEKSDEILLPVIKSMTKPQTTIEEFFPLEMIQRRRQLDLSKRIKDATERLKKGRNKINHRIEDEEIEKEIEKSAKRKKL